MASRKQDKRLISASILLTLFTILLITLDTSCGKCDDCGPATHYAFGIRNATDLTLTFSFFENGDSTVFILLPREEFELVHRGSFSGISGVLPTTPINVYNLEERSAFDSVTIERNNTIILYTAEDCSASNPLCVESYAQGQIISRNSQVATKTFIYTYE